MSDTAAPSARTQATVVRLYGVVAILMVLTIAVLVAYVIRLGPLVGTGVESSFGIAVALMFLCSAMVVHLVDRTYRVWPAGRHVGPTTPGPVSDRAIASFLKVVVIVAVAAAVAYVFATLLI